MTITTESWPMGERVENAINTLALALNDIEEIETDLRTEAELLDPAKIELETVGRLVLFARDCERIAGEINERATSIFTQTEIIYGSDPEPFRRWLEANRPAES